MIKLRTLLLSNKPYLLILITVFLITFIRINIKYESNFKNDTIIKGKVTDIYINKDNLKISLNSKDKITAIYYFKNKKELNKFNIKLGDIVILKGKMEKPSNNTVPNTFNYKKYLYNNNQFFIFHINSYKKVKNNSNGFFFLKQKIIDHINRYKTSPYLQAFILGNTSYIKKDIRTAFQEIGISHLFAISGMHTTLLSGLILKGLKKLKVEETKRYVLACLFLFIYLLLSFSPSVLRSFLFFLLLSINKIKYLYIKTTNIFYLTLSISLIINPFYIYNIGFLFSYSISYALILSIEYLKQFSSFKQSFLVSLISFLVSFPICIYNFYQINLLSIIYNLFFVPLISIIIFPLSLLTFIFPFLDNVLLIIITIFERIVIIFNNVNIFKLILAKPNILLILLYYLFIFLFIIKHNKKYLIMLLILVLYHFNINSFIKSNYLITIDVGQGDSMLMYLNKQSILIDTGGKKDYSNLDGEITNISNNTITMLKSYGVRRINFLILTHGDYDHMGEAINLVNNFKVEKVIFNCGPYNDLEKELIEVLDKKKIKYYSCIKELNIDNNKLYFLQTKEYDNENDNSNVIYTELNGYKFMFMGDAGVEKEKDILDKYNLSNIDVLKVGHHGSKTSSSKELINQINPRYSIISVGKNNRYGHPNKEVLDNLKESKIYRTDKDGSIMFKIKNNKLKIDTCSP